MKIMEYDLKITCEACPEQYDVFRNGKQVAYFRLRHGYFYVSVPNCSDNIIYEANPVGDGIFEYNERGKFLNEAILAVDRWYNQSLHMTPKNWRM